MTKKHPKKDVFYYIHKKQYKDLRVSVKELLQF